MTRLSNLLLTGSMAEAVTLNWLGPVRFAVPRIDQLKVKLKGVIKWIRRHLTTFVALGIIIPSLYIFICLNSTPSNSNLPARNFWIYHENSNSSVSKEQRITLDPIPSELSCHVTSSSSQNVTVSIPGKTDFIEQVPNLFPERFEVLQNKSHLLARENETSFMISSISYYPSSEVTLWRCQFFQMPENKTYPIKVKWLNCLTKHDYDEYELVLHGNTLGLNGYSNSLIGPKAERILFEVIIKPPYRIEGSETYPEWDDSGPKQRIIGNRTEVVDKIYRWECSGEMIEIAFSDPGLEDIQEIGNMILSGSFGLGIGIWVTPLFDKTREEK
jgi:hypothetical protein